MLFNKAFDIRASAGYSPQLRMILSVIITATGGKFND
jgi:hypothetical protein